MDSTNHSKTTNYCAIGKEIIRLEADRTGISKLEISLRSKSVTCFDMCRTIDIDGKGFIIPENHPANLNYANKHPFISYLAVKLAKLISIDVVSRTRNVQLAGDRFVGFNKFNIDVTFGSIQESFSSEEIKLLIHAISRNPSYYPTVKHDGSTIDPNSIFCNHRTGLNYCNILNHLGLDKGFARSTAMTNKLPLPGTIDSQSDPK